MKPLKLLISGPVGAGKTTFIRSLSETEVVDTDAGTTEDIGKPRTTVAMDFGTLTLAGIPVHIWGTPGQERFEFMWDILATGAIGLILLVAGDQPRDFPRARNILEAITSRHPVPFVVGVTRQDLRRVWGPDDVADYFALPEIQVLGLNATDPWSSVQALAQLLSVARKSDWDGGRRQIKANDTSFQELRLSITEQLPPPMRFSAEDAAAIGKHQEFLTGLTEGLVSIFYDTLFGYGPTKAIVRDAERPARADTLRMWWKRLIDGQIDDKFWDWITFVGLDHVHRRLSNPMMIGIWGGIASFIGEQAATKMDAADALRLQQAFIRFGQTLTSIVAESYLRSYIKAVAESTGTSATLLDSLVRQEVDTMLADARRQHG